MWSRIRGYLYLSYRAKHTLPSLYAGVVACRPSLVPGSDAPLGVYAAPLGEGWCQ